ncbi:hypothetical protein DFJ74DRAFT_321596 [Hyaloraphidium curvatum]|nr:hypothetical protein DFJ74DRAFT_321596 [Hyaloraphidium curvatum]
MRTLFLPGLRWKRRTTTSPCSSMRVRRRTERCPAGTIRKSRRSLRQRALRPRPRMRKSSNEALGFVPSAGRIQSKRARVPKQNGSDDEEDSVPRRKSLRLLASPVDSSRDEELEKDTVRSSSEPSDQTDDPEKGPKASDCASRRKRKAPRVNGAPKTSSHRKLDSWADLGTDKLDPYLRQVSRTPSAPWQRVEIHCAFGGHGNRQCATVTARGAILMFFCIRLDRDGGNWVKQGGNKLFLSLAGHEWDNVVAKNYPAVPNGRFPVYEWLAANQYKFRGLFEIERLWDIGSLPKKADWQGAEMKRVKGADPVAVFWNRTIDGGWKPKA